MAHFAKIENGKVVNVIVLNNEDIGGGDFPDDESTGLQYISDNLDSEGTYVQTSYNRNFRGRFAGKGLNWNGSVFHGDQPYPSWTLDENGDWRPPVQPSNIEGNQVWDEDSSSWIAS